MSTNFREQWRRLKRERDLAVKDPQYKFDAWDGIISLVLAMCIILMVGFWVMLN